MEKNKNRYLLNLFRLHVGWLRYVDDDTLFKLTGLTKDQFGQYDDIMIENEKEDKEDTLSMSSSSSFAPVNRPVPFKQQLNKRGVLFKMLVPSTKSVVQNRITHEQEMECPTSWKLLQREEFYVWVRDEIGNLVEKMGELGDTLWSDDEKKEEMRYYDDLEWMLKVVMVSLMDDENYESVFLKDVGKRSSAVDVKEEEEGKGNLYDAFYKKKGRDKHSMREMLQKDVKTMEVKKTLEKMVWRGFKSLEDVQVICFNLMMGCRLWRRVLSGVLELRKPSLGIEDIMFQLHVVGGLRDGAYFPTIMDPYEGGDGRLMRDPRVFLFFRDVLLDELSLHLYNDGLRGGSYGSSIPSTTKQNEEKKEEEKEKMDKKILQSQWAWFSDLYGGQGGIGGGREVDNTDVLEDSDDESDVSMDSEDMMRRKYHTPSKLLIDGKLRNIVFKKPPIGSTSKMDKWIEKHENLMVKYNIKKTRETMKVMQKEHVMEMRLRKSKKMFIVDQKKANKTNTAVALKNEKDLPFDTKGVKKSPNEVQPVKDGEKTNFMKGRVALHPSMDSIVESFPVPKLFKDIFGQGGDDLGASQSSSIYKEGLYLKNRLEQALEVKRRINMGEDVEDIEVELDDDNDEIVEEDILTKEKELELLEKTSKLKKAIKDVVYVSMGSLTWMQVEKTYRDVYSYEEVVWKNIEHLVMNMFLLYASRANEKEIVMDVHEWMLCYFFTPLWKRESYKRSGTGKINMKPLDCWRYAETEYYVKTYENIDFLSPLRDLIMIHYPGFPLVDYMEPRTDKPILDNKYCGIFLSGFFHCLLKTLEDDDINNMIVGDFMNPMIQHPFQHEFFAYIVYWWLKQQMLQIPVDVDRTIFMWELEIKYHSLYRGGLANPVICRVGSDWVVFVGGNPMEPLWSKGGMLNGINCGRYIFIALYVWMMEMEKFGWNVEERVPSLRVWNEFIPLDKKDASETHRRGVRVNIKSSLIYQFYKSLESSREKGFML